jgi:ketosteroid isomerase-like protein
MYYLTKTSDKIMKVNILAIGLIVLMSSTVFAQTNAKLKKEITESEAKFVNVFASTGGVGLKDLYSTDAIIFPPGSNSISGNVAIGNYWKGGFDAGVKSLKLTTRDVEGSESLAVEYGEYVLVGANGSPMDNGKYVVIWKKVNGEWKLSRDIWNSSVASK